LIGKALDTMAVELERGIAIGVQEVVGADNLIAVLVFRVEARGLHHDVDPRVLRSSRIVVERAVEIAKNAFFFQHSPFHDGKPNARVDRPSR
jgi:hypothetical protein